MSSYSAEVS